MIINMQSGGVVPERILDAQTITPSTENQVIDAGTYLRGALTVVGDADLVPTNIPSDVKLFGVQGTRSPNYGANAWSKSIDNGLIYNEQSISDVNVGSGSYNSTITAYYADSFSYDETTKKFTLVNPNSRTCLLYQFYQESAYFPNKYIISDITKTSGATLYKVSSISTEVYGSGDKYRRLEATGVSLVPAHDRDIVSFVVDDNNTAYPNGAIHTDGYYYELLGQVTSTNAMNLTDNALAVVQQDYRDQVETEVSNANA